MAVTFEVTALVTFRVPWRLARTERLAAERIENLEGTGIDQGIEDIEISAVQVNRTDRERN